MLRKFYTAGFLAAALAISPAAMADGKSVTVEIDLDPILLTTDEGFTDTMEIIETKAKISCSYSKPLIRTPETDDACVEEVMTNAKVQLRQIAQTAAGTVVADKS